MRKPAASSFPSPKRGMLRLILRRPAATKKKSDRPPRDSVAYVPEDQQIDNKRFAEPRLQTWCTSFLKLSQQSELGLIKDLLNAGVLKKFACCPHCGHGKLSCRWKDHRRGYVQRCSARACHKFVLPHSHHPVFVASWGVSHVPLRQQALVLFCLVARVEPGKIHLLTGLGRKVVESVCARWRKALVSFVEKKQLTIQLGDGKKWSQCEVDEVTCRGKRRGQRVTWYQYCGLLKRGDRRTLILAKMKVKATFVKPQRQRSRVNSLTRSYHQEGVDPDCQQVCQAQKNLATLRWCSCVPLLQNTRSSHGCRQAQETEACLHSLVAACASQGPD